MVSNPPPFTALTAWMYGALTGSTLVIDAHTGVFLEPKWRPFRPLNRFLMRRAALTVVTNRALQEQVEQWGAHAFVLPDPLPKMSPGTERYPLDESRFNIAAVFSFYEDEPIEEMLAVDRLPHDTHIYVTGDPSRVPRSLRLKCSPQLTLTGFLPRPRYEALLCQCDAVLVLCTRPHTLLCGAYEAVAAGKPLVTSDSAAMREHFRAGTIFVTNSTAGIEAGVEAVRRRSKELTREVVWLRHQLRREWKTSFERCLALICDNGSMRQQFREPPSAGDVPGARARIAELSRRNGNGRR